LNNKGVNLIYKKTYVVKLRVRSTWTGSPNTLDYESGGSGLSRISVLSLYRFLIIGIPNQGIRISFK